MPRNTAIAASIGTTLPVQRLRSQPILIAGSSERAYSGTIGAIVPPIGTTPSVRVPTTTGS